MTQQLLTNGLEERLDELPRLYQSSFIDVLFGQKYQLLPQVSQRYEIDLAFGETQSLSEDDLVKRSAYLYKVGDRITNHYRICQRRPVQVDPDLKHRQNFFDANAFGVGYATHGLFPYRGKFHPQMIKGLMNIIGLGEPKIRSGGMSESLTVMAPKFSELLIHCPHDPASYDPGPHGVTLTFLQKDLASGKVNTIQTVCLFIICSLKLPDGLSFAPPPSKPPCLISVQNEFDLTLGGEITSESGLVQAQKDKPQPFVAKTRLKIPTGWLAIEIYPNLDIEYWKPEFARTWAETDLLAAVTRKHLEDEEFRAADPNAAARKRFGHLLEQFESILNGPEEPVHQFLKDHPEIISPTHTNYWSKLQLGKRDTDFVFLEPPNDYLLVEIESPFRELFRRDGQQREEFTHALNQITDWKRYIEDNLRYVQDELGLAGISASPRSLLVIGRSSFLTEENRRKIITMQNENPKLRIFTYDDLMTNAKSVVENLLGPLWIIGENTDVYYLPKS